MKRLTDKLSEITGKVWFAQNTQWECVLTTLPIVASATRVGGFCTKVRLATRTSQIIVYSVHLEPRWSAYYLPRGYSPNAVSGLGSEFGGWGNKLDHPITDPEYVSTVNANSGRPQQVQTIINDANNEIAANNYVIIAGDFNEPSCFDWTEETKDLFDHNGTVIDWASTATLRDAGWSDGYRELYPDPARYPAITWASDMPSSDLVVMNIGGGLDADNRDRIDFVFHKSEQLELTSAWIIGPEKTVANTYTRMPKTGDDNFFPLEEFLLHEWPTDHKGNLMEYQLRPLTT